MIRISLSANSQGTKKIDVFSQGTDDFKNLGCKTLYITDYEYVNISSFAVLDRKLWLEENSNLDTNRLYFHSSLLNRRLKSDTKFCHLLAITLYPT